MYREHMSKAGMVVVQIHDRLWSWQGDRLYRLLVAGLLGTLVLSAVLLWTGFRSPDDHWETVAGSRAAVAIESFKLRRLTYRLPPECAIVVLFDSPGAVGRCLSEISGDAAKDEPSVR